MSFGWGYSLSLCEIVLYINFYMKFDWIRYNLSIWCFTNVWCCMMLLIAEILRCSSMLTAKRKASVAFHVPRTDTTTRRHDEETSLQRIRWILFAPKLSCWKLAKRFFASRNVSIFNTCLKQKVSLSYNCENQVENISFKGKGIDHWCSCWRYATILSQPFDFMLPFPACVFANRILTAPTAALETEKKSKWRFSKLSSR